MFSSARSKRRRILIILVIAFVLAGSAFLLLKNDQKADNSVATSTAKAKKAENKPAKTYPVINLQPTVEAWAASQPNTASVVIYDLANNKTVSSLNPNEQYFTASLYKLYVAYEGYKKIEDGTYKLNDPYLTGYNRGECLDAMIRQSYSPCGEKMWNELGKQKLTDQLKNYGITHTSMIGLTTTAHDAAIILQRLFERKELNKKDTNLYLDSLKDQPKLYRRGLPSGFKKSIVYNKVGWNGTVEWHDAAIVTLPNGRSYVIVVLTQNVGSQNIAELAEAIEAKLIN